VIERIFEPASSGWEEMGGVSGADPTTDGSGMPWKDVVLGWCTSGGGESDMRGYAAEYMCFVEGPPLQ
jgi:hypothetical protein